MPEEHESGRLRLRFGPDARSHDRVRTTVLAAAALGLLVTIGLTAPESLWWNRPTVVREGTDGLVPYLYLLAAIGLLEGLFLSDPGWDRGYFSDACYLAGWAVAVAVGLLIGPLGAGGMMAAFPFRLARTRWAGMRSWVYWLWQTPVLGLTIVWWSGMYHPLTPHLWQYVVLPSFCLAVLAGAYVASKKEEPTEPSDRQD